jgi:uncharacterized membrane protein HdeD (DUF308 family)
VVNIISPKGFLQVGGVVLLLVGLLGFFGIIGPTPEQSVFGDAWWFDNGENIAHTVLGVVALLAAYLLKSADAQRWLVMLVGILGLLFGVLNFFLPADAPNFYGVANLESPLDMALHFVIGIWGVWAAAKKPGMSMPAGV